MQRLARIGLGVGAGVCLLITIIVLAVVLKPSSEDLGPLDGPWDNIRLPENIKARKYKLSLDINWEKWEYSGTQEVTVDVDGADPVEYFLIHSKGLDINKAATTLKKVEGEELSDVTVKRSFMDTDKNSELRHDFYVVQSDAPVDPGTYKMKIAFTGKVKTGTLTGLYRSKYTRQIPNSDPSNVIIYQIATDFEPVDARSAFPCFDEPAQKASWENEIKVTFPAGIDVNEYVIHSNMPLKDETNYVREGQTLSASFEESVVMSTYLVCFTVTDFLSKDGTYKRDDGTEVALRVLTRREPDFLEAASYALEVTSKILKEYEKFFKVIYPLPKLDQIALPEFNSGAMENWGLITYRESALLYNEVTSSNSEKQRVCAVIAHEIAHQWFGNIVTMAWWNDLWLNEGFASFVEYYGIDAAEPTWNILDFFYPDEITGAMNFDSAPSSHPISVNVSSPDELSGLFDTISYSKGSSINWMMQKFMGEEAFANGLKAYIEEFEGKNAVMVDLFNALSKAKPDINVKEIMMTWTMQMGFPYVDVKLDTLTTPGKTIITLTQNRFLVGDKLSDDESPYGYKWYIPFTYLDGTETSDIAWMKPDAPDGQTSLTVEKTLTWIKGNAGGNYYYIVNYEDAVLAKLKEELEKKPRTALTAATDRTSLFYDVFSLASIGKKTYSTALDMTKYATDETEYVVLARILTSVYGAASNIKDDAAAYAKFKTYTVNMLKPRVDELTWDAGNDEPITIPKMRDMAIRNYCWAVGNKADATVVKALEKFAAFSLDPAGEKSKIKDVFTTVLRTAIIYDDDDNTNWDKMWSLLQASDWEADQRSYIAALCKSKNKAVLEKMIEDSFQENVKAGTWRYLYYLNFYGEDRYQYAWELLQTNWNEYTERYNETSFTMGYLVDMPAVFDTEDKYNEVKEFFDSKDDSIGTGKKTVQETLSKIKSNIKWKKENAQDVKDWFNSL